MNSEKNFYTFGGYDQKSTNEITHTMEDYLEMICRISEKMGYTRINTLAQRLNVKPPSASKMVAKLKEKDLVDYQPYGIIMPTEKGWEVGNYFLKRHELLHDFFCTLNGTTNELEQVEQIEHFIDKRTFKNLELLLPKLKSKSL